MAILSREELNKRIKERIGEDTSDEAIQLIEDINDTYDSLNKGNGANDDGEDWKSRYEENDKMWRQKYRDRFFEPVPNSKDPTNPEPEEIKTDEEKKAETVTINDLFSSADKKE